MSERGSTEVQSPASDRVTELYRGEIWDRKSQQVCRDRIHWMCSRVTGQRLLDVGCSQGIATLLLGQEGHKVVGVDIDPAAIEFAQRELATYPDFVKENVEFWWARTNCPSKTVRSTASSWAKSSNT
jgi:2-polyprenyl-3-methyl-5-hydroxy-6-metoxy-1,4-benzoquinol methylase